MIEKYIWDKLIAKHCEIEVGKKLLTKMPYIKIKIFGKLVAYMEYNEIEALFALK